MSELIVKEKEIVVPGEVLAKGMEYLPAAGTYREGDEIRALQVGMVNLSGRLIKIVPLKGTYIPKVDDIIIGRISNVGISNWLVEIGFCNLAGLSLRDTNAFIARGADLSNYYRFGDYIVAGVTRVTRDKVIDITTRGQVFRKLEEGTIIKINPVKVPRVIGKGGSMISMIKERTDCRIMVGQNGFIWISGSDPIKEKLAIDAIYLIEENAHKEGLTDVIDNFLGKKPFEKSLGKNEEKKEIKKEEIKEEVKEEKPFEKSLGKNEEKKEAPKEKKKEEPSLEKPFAKSLGKNEKPRERKEK